MQTKHIFVIWSCIKINVRCRVGKTGLRFPVAFLLAVTRRFFLQSFFVCASVVFVLSLFVHRLYF